MANICNLSMMIRGTKENRESFINALTQNGNIWMGRGVTDTEIDNEWDDDASLIDGWCKWSVQSACIDNAISMRNDPSRWAGIEDANEFITLWEACQRWNITMEVYSEECGCEFQEHMIYDKGIVLDECIDYYEYYLGEFETKEEAESELEISITDEEWEKKDDEYISRGGYPDWDFEI